MTRSPKLQRLTAMAVPALLAANAMVLVLGLSVTDDAKPASADAADAAGTVTYIRAADGTLRLVDPTTPEGWKAIAEANQRGETVVTVPEGEEPAELMQQSATSTTLAPGGLEDDLDQLLDDTESTVVKTIGQLGDTVDGVVDDLTDVIDKNAGTNVGDLLDEDVDKTTDTLTTTVSTVVADTRNTATTVVDTVTPVEPVPTPLTDPQPVTEVVPNGGSQVPVEAPDLGL